MTAEDLIKEFEGCKLTAYPDPATGGEPWTIGYGHTHGVREGMTITQEQADRFLADDLKYFRKGVNDLLGEAPTSDCQREAFVSLAYNIGLERLAGSSALRFHKNGWHARAADAILWWNKANGRVMKGLIRRRQAEKRLYETDDVR